MMLLEWVRSLRDRLTGRPELLALAALGISVVVTAGRAVGDVGQSYSVFDVPCLIIAWVFERGAWWTTAIAVLNLVVLPLCAGRRIVPPSEERLFLASRMIGWNTFLVLLWALNFFVWGFAALLIPVLLLMQIARVCYVFKGGTWILGVFYVIHGAATVLWLLIVNLVFWNLELPGGAIAPDLMVLCYVFATIVVGWELASLPPEEAGDRRTVRWIDVYRVWRGLPPGGPPNDET